jgi:hypothetical protein
LITKEVYLALKLKLSATWATIIGSPSTTLTQARSSFLLSIFDSK